MSKQNEDQQKTVKKYKLLGQIILALSFLIQTLLFDYYNTKSDQLDKAYTNQSLIDKGAELKEVKYFVCQFPSDTITQKKYQLLNINMAATKIAESQMMMIISSDKSKKEKTDRSNALLQRAYAVKDFDDYMNFIDFVNKNAIKAEDIINNIESINNNKDIFRFVFLLFYLIGTGYLVVGLKYEKS